MIVMTSLWLLFVVDSWKGAQETAFVHARFFTEASCLQTAEMLKARQVKVAICFKEPT